MTGHRFFTGLLALVVLVPAGCGGKSNQGSPGKKGPDPCEALYLKIKQCGTSRYVQKQIADHEKFVNECRKAGDLMKESFACARIGECKAFEDCFYNLLMGH